MEQLALERGRLVGRPTVKLLHRGAVQDVQRVLQGVKVQRGAAKVQEVHAVGVSWVEYEALGRAVVVETKVAPLVHGADDG